MFIYLVENEKKGFLNTIFNSIKIDTEYLGFQREFKRKTVL